MMERDLAELKGIEWFLKNYLSHDLEFLAITDAQSLIEEIDLFKPDVLLLEMELLPAQLDQALTQYKIPIIALTAEPLFQQAMKAIRIRAMNLFVKPIPLEQLKTALMSIQPQAENDVVVIQNSSLYDDLFLQSERRFSLDHQSFFLIECAQFQNNLKLYEWLSDLPIFDNLTLLPLQNRIIGIAQIEDDLQLSKQLRLIMLESRKSFEDEINIALYTGIEVNLLTMYQSCKEALSRRFYEGYSHILKSSDSLQIVRLDPLLTPDEQQLWIDSLEDGDLATVKTLLYRLTKSTTHYNQDDVRIHLTSIIAQIRRYMMKYQLQQLSHFEVKYRNLFHLILEHPILYAIVQEFVLFIQQLMDHIQNAQKQSKADYAELAVTYIEQHFQDPELSLPVVAEQLNISANYLSNFFSRKRGIPFKKFVQQYRLQRAAELLMTTEHTISTISELVGFMDHNYFTKVFRAYFQSTPYKYKMKKVGLAK